VGKPQTKSANRAEAHMDGMPPRPVHSSIATERYAESSPTPGATTPLFSPPALSTRSRSRQVSGTIMRMLCPLTMCVFVPCLRIPLLVWTRVRLWRARLCKSGVKVLSWDDWQDTLGACVPHLPYPALLVLATDHSSSRKGGGRGWDAWRS